MGDPKRTRKKYERSKIMWDRDRISKEHALKEKFGLRNLRELWKVTTEVSRIRRNAREVLSGRSGEAVGKSIVGRLSRYSIVPSDSKVDDLLGITPEAILSRRLQSVVLKNGLARTMKQSRQLVTHGFISINGRKVKSPGYMVTSSEETKIGYYKPIDLTPPEQGAGSNAHPQQPAKVEAPAAANVEKKSE